MTKMSTEPNSVYKIVTQKVGAMHVADSLAAGSAVGFGYQLMFQLDIIISIIAGSLVAVSAGLSIYINLMERRLKKKEQVKDESDS